MIGYDDNSYSEMRFCNQCLTVGTFRVVPEGRLDLFPAPDDRRIAGTLIAVGSELNSISNHGGRSSFLGHRGNVPIVIFAN